MNKKYITPKVHNIVVKNTILAGSLNNEETDQPQLSKDSRGIFDYSE